MNRYIITTSDDVLNIATSEWAGCRWLCVRLTQLQILIFWTPRQAAAKRGLRSLRVPTSPKWRTARDRRVAMTGWLDIERDDKVMRSGGMTLATSRFSHRRRSAPRRMIRHSWRMSGEAELHDQESAPSWET